MEYLVIGLATAFNFTIIVKKLRLKRIADALLDCSMFVAICFLFSGTFGALATGAIASALISLYLLFNPFYIAELVGSSPKTAQKQPCKAQKEEIRPDTHAGILRGSGRNCRRSAYVL